MVCTTSTINGQFSDQFLPVLDFSAFDYIIIISNFQKLYKYDVNFQQDGTTITVRI